MDSKSSYELLSRTSDSVGEPTPFMDFLDSDDTQSEQLNELQKTLNNITAMAHEAEQFRLSTLRQCQRLEVLQNQLLDKECELNEKEQFLEKHSATLQKEQKRTAEWSSNLQARQKTLDEREAILQSRTKDLAMGYQKLSSNRARLSVIVKKFQDSMKVKDAQPQYSGESSMQQVR